MVVIYTKLHIALHWIMAALIIGNYLLGSVSEDLQPDTVEWIYGLSIHMAAGILTLVLVVPRLIAREYRIAPVNLDPDWRENAGKAVHHLLYSMTVMTPLTGIVVVLLFRSAFPLFDVYLLPFYGESPTLKEVASDFHTLLGNFLIILVVIHIAVAFWHAVVLRDDVVGRMLPSMRRAPPQQSVGVKATGTQATGTQATGTQATGTQAPGSHASH